MKFQVPKRKVVSSVILFIAYCRVLNYIFYVFTYTILARGMILPFCWLGLLILCLYSNHAMSISFPYPIPIPGKKNLGTVIKLLNSICKTLHLNCQESFIHCTLESFELHFLRFIRAIFAAGILLRCCWLRLLLISCLYSNHAMSMPFQDAWISYHIPKPGKKNLGTVMKLLQKQKGIQTIMLIVG